MENEILFYDNFYLILTFYFKVKKKNHFCHFIQANYQLVKRNYLCCINEYIQKDFFIHYIATQSPRNIID